MAGTLRPGGTKVAGTLLPGERQKVTFSISGTAGQLAATSLVFHIRFGSGAQDSRYAGNAAPASASAQAAAIKTSTGVGPAGFPGAFAGREVG